MKRLSGSEWWRVLYVRECGIERTDFPPVNSYNTRKFRAVEALVARGVLIEVGREVKRTSKGEEFTALSYRVDAGKHAEALKAGPK